MTKSRLITLAIILLLILSKAIWVGVNMSDIGSFESEKQELLQRRNYLIEKIMVAPDDLLNEMPHAVGPQFQGEWALYSCSMLSAALVNMSNIYRDTKNDAIPVIDSLIKIVLSEQIRSYDTERWSEDPLETLDGDLSHISYLSHLAWMISGYKQVDGDAKYDPLYKSLCETMNRRILQSPTLNLQTYPGEYIYLPDMLVAIVALANYSKQNNGEYNETVNKWLTNIQKNWIDKKTGIVMSFIPDGEDWVGIRPIQGSYSALSCYYLTFVDKEFAYEQYLLLKEHFLKNWPITGFKEYWNRSKWLGFDIDAGPIIANLSPTGTAFGLGSITYFKDFELRKRFLKTAELAGSTVTVNDKTHYLLANIALVGEAITLAMRTAVEWDF